MHNKIRPSRVFCGACSQCVYAATIIKASTKVAATASAVYFTPRVAIAARRGYTHSECGTARAGLGMAAGGQSVSRCPSSATKFSYTVVEPPGACESEDVPEVPAGTASS